MKNENYLMSRKLLPLLIIIPILILGSFLVFKSKSAEPTSASAPLLGLTLDLDFGNNNSSDPVQVYDSSGFNRNTTSTTGTTMPACTPYFCDFDGGDNTTGDATNIFNSANISIATKFSPDFTADDGVLHYIFDTQASGTEGYILIKVSDNSLRVYLGGTNIETIPLSSYQAYWKVGEENVLVVRGDATNDDTYMWLNGNIILNNDQSAWTESNSTAYYIGSNLNKVYCFDGKIYYLKVWSRLLSDAEVQHLSADRKTNMR